MFSLTKKTNFRNNFLRSNTQKKVNILFLISCLYSSCFFLFFFFLPFFSFNYIRLLVCGLLKDYFSKSHKYDKKNVTKL